MNPRIHVTCTRAESACCCRVVNDMSKCRIVAGALLEGDGEDAADGNAGTWIQLVLMLEEVRG